MPVVNDCPEFDLGDTATVFAVFIDPNGTPPGVSIDPSEVFLQVLAPGAEALEEYEYGDIDGVITNTDEGVYQADIDCNAPGEWFWRFYSTGTGKAADEGNFRVRPSRTLGQS